MGLGIVNPRRRHPDADPELCVPGTIIFQNMDVLHVNEMDNKVLFPIPTSQPDDPLNWPLWKKEIVLTILCAASIIAATLSSILATNTLTLVFAFGINLTEAAGLTGYFLLGVGCSSWITSASACVYGKRHTYVLGSILLVAGSTWAAFGTSPST